MAVKKKTFKKVADKLINKTFSDFKAPLTIKNSLPAEYPNPPTNITETHEGIRASYSASEVDGQAIQSSDYKIVTERVLWTSVDVRADNTSATFDGKEIDIVSVNYDSADATYIFQARDK